MTEHEIQGLILQYLAVHGIPAQRTNTGAMLVGAGPHRRFVSFNKKGTSDISGVIPPNGRALFIEVKSASGRVSPSQKEWLAIRERAGALCIVARSLEDVKKILEN